MRFTYPPGVRVEHVDFPTGGAEGGMSRCAADLYLPEHEQQPDPGRANGQRSRPGVILFWSGLLSKEANAGIAWYLTRAGYVCLAMDFRTSGASPGTPRGQQFPDSMMTDVRSALFWLRSRPEVDPERIALHGVSFGGGLAMQVAAFDRRVSVVAALYPSSLVGLDLPQSMIEEDIRQRLETGEGGSIPLLPADSWPEPARGYALQSVELYPTFDNRMLVESLEKLATWWPARYADKVAPTPVQFIGASGRDDFHDLTAMREVGRNGLREPKRLVVLPYDSMGLYVEPGLGEAARATIEWLDHHLRGEPLPDRTEPPGEPAETPLAPEAAAAGLVPGFANWNPSWDPAA